MTNSTTLESRGVVAQAATAADAVSAHRLADPVQRGPILLAIHGGEATSTAITAAHLLAERLSVDLRVMTVVELAYAFGGAPELLPVARTPDVAIAGDQPDAVRRRLHEVLGASGNWALDVRFGSPGRQIPRVAREMNASLIIVDAAPRRGLRHEVSGVRALQVVARSSCPVLSVPPSFAGLPRTVVAAVDFSPASISAALAALRIAADGARFVLVHAPVSLSSRRAFRDESGALYGGDISAHFERVRAQLEPYAPAGVTIETRTIEGSVVREVLSIAESDHAELLAVGTQGHGVVERFFVGSVAAGLLHSASCPVLVSPVPSAAEFMRLELRMSDDASTTDPKAWREVLQAANERNNGRRITVEVDDPESGAQVLAEGYLLRSIVYDVAERSVEVAVDEGAGGTGHLSRSIGKVRSIGIHAAPGGRDQAIAIAHGRGQTLIRFDD